MLHAVRTLSKTIAFAFTATVGDAQAAPTWEHIATVACANQSGIPIQIRAQAQADKYLYAIALTQAIRSG